MNAIPRSTIGGRRAPGDRCAATGPVAAYWPLPARPPAPSNCRGPSCSTTISIDVTRKRTRCRFLFGSQDKYNSDSHTSQCGSRYSSESSSICIRRVKNQTKQIFKKKNISNKSFTFVVEKMLLFLLSLHYRNRLFFCLLYLLDPGSRRSPIMRILILLCFASFEKSPFSRKKILGCSTEDGRLPDFRPL